MFTHKMKVYCYNHSLRNCSVDTTGGLEPSHAPSCPAVELDTCAEECEGDENCPESQLCCRGCGSSCREAVNLPYYNVPLFCPMQAVSLAEDSATCDLQCNHDNQCPGNKICCHYGCSSSCQDGFIPLEPCYLLREALDGSHEGEETTREREDGDEERDDEAAEDDDDDDEREEEDDDDEEDDEAPLLGRFVPGCSPQGHFNPVQIWEGNRWCVNVVTGKPISPAYSRALNFTCPSKPHLL